MAWLESGSSFYLRKCLTHTTVCSSTLPRKSLLVLVLTLQKEEGSNPWDIEQNATLDLALRKAKIRTRCDENVLLFSYVLDFTTFAKKRCCVVSSRDLWKLPLSLIIFSSYSKSILKRTFPTQTIIRVLFFLCTTVIMTFCYFTLWVILNNKEAVKMNIDSIIEAYFKFFSI